MNETLGVDVGGVLISRANDTADTSFFRTRYLEAVAVCGAFETVARLARNRFGGRLVVISKCGPRTEERTKEWLAYHHAYDALGITPHAVHFCRQRQEKAPLCEALGVTHFVDDKLEVLGYLATVPHRFLFDPVEAEVQKFKQHLPFVTRVANWKQLEELLIA